jgi:hypothetical protein
MQLLVIFVCSGLLVYWIARMFLMIRCSQEEIEETLACDLWWGRRLLLCLRSGFEPPHQFIG